MEPETSKVEFSDYELARLRVTSSWALLEKLRFDMSDYYDTRFNRLKMAKAISIATKDEGVIPRGTGLSRASSYKQGDMWNPLLRGVRSLQGAEPYADRLMVSLFHSMRSSCLESGPYIALAELRHSEFSRDAVMNKSGLEYLIKVADKLHEQRRVLYSSVGPKATAQVKSALRFEFQAMTIFDDVRYKIIKKSTMVAKRRNLISGAKVAPSDVDVESIDAAVMTALARLMTSPVMQLRDTSMCNSLAYSMLFRAVYLELKSHATALESLAGPIQTRLFACSPVVVKSSKNARAAVVKTVDYSLSAWELRLWSTWLVAKTMVYVYELLERKSNPRTLSLSILLALWRRCIALVYNCDHHLYVKLLRQISTPHLDDVDLNDKTSSPTSDSDSENVYRKYVAEGYGVRVCSRHGRDAVQHLIEEEKVEQLCGSDKKNAHLRDWYLQRERHRYAYDPSVPMRSSCEKISSTSQTFCGKTLPVTLKQLAISMSGEPTETVLEAVQLAGFYNVLISATHASDVVNTLIDAPKSFQMVTCCTRPMLGHTSLACCITCSGVYTQCANVPGDLNHARVPLMWQLFGQCEFLGFHMTKGSRVCLGDPSSTYEQYASHKDFGSVAPALNTRHVLDWFAPPMGSMIYKTRSASSVEGACPDGEQTTGSSCSHTAPEAGENATMQLFFKSERDGIQHVSAVDPFSIDTCDQLWGRAAVLAKDSLHENNGILGNDSCSGEILWKFLELTPTCDAIENPPDYLLSLVMGANSMFAAYLDDPSSRRQSQRSNSLSSGNTSLNVPDLSRTGMLSSADFERVKNETVFRWALQEAVMWRRDLWKHIVGLCNVDIPFSFHCLLHECYEDIECEDQTCKDARMFWSAAGPCSTFKVSKQQWLDRLTVSYCDWFGWIDEQTGKCMFCPDGTNCATTRGENIPDGRVVFESIFSHADDGICSLDESNGLAKKSASTARNKRKRQKRKEKRRAEEQERECLVCMATDDTVRKHTSCKINRCVYWACAECIRVYDKCPYNCSIDSNSSAQQNLAFGCSI